MLAVRVLGPVEVDEDGQPVALGTPRERAVLAWLAARAPETVSAEALIDALWGDDPPATAGKTLQTLISRLRKSIGDGAIDTIGKGYRLAVPPEHIDLHRIERLAVEASDRVGCADQRGAVSMYDEALALWRGDPLADCAGSPVADAEIVRLHELRNRIIDERHDALLASGAGAELVGDLEHAVAASPLREKRWGQLMVALYRAGRQADALDAYQRCRKVLVEELGIEPGPALRVLEQNILEHNPVLLGSSANRDAPSDRSSTAIADLRWTPAATVEFTARTGPFEMLMNVWQDTVARGDRRLVLVSGEAGIGKTRLAAEVAQRVAAEGAVVLHGRCDDAGAPYQPISESLDFYGSTVPREVLGEQCGGSAVYVARVSPVIGDRLDVRMETSIDPESDGLRIANAVSALLDEIASDRPLLLVIDDLHWASIPTLRLVYHLLRDSGSAPVMIIGTLRPPSGREPDEHRRLTGELHRTERVLTVPLAGLDVDGVSDLSAAMAGHELTGAMGDAAPRLHQLTGGNPYLLIQTLLHLRDSGAIVREGDRWVLADPTIGDAVLPAGTSEVLALRVGQLEPSQVAVLRTAAVVGLSFDLDTVAAVTDSTASVDDALDAAVKIGLIGEGDRYGQYTYAHDLLRQHLLGGLSSFTVTRLHWRIAEHFAATNTGNVDDLARHAWDGAHAGDPVTAAGWMHAAAREALERSAPDAALVHLSHALDVLGAADPTSALRCDVLTDRAIAMLEADAALDDPSFIDACDTAETAAIATGDPARIVRAVTLDHRWNPALDIGVIDRRRDAAVRRALQAVPADSDQAVILTGYLAEVDTHHPDVDARTALIQQVHDAVANGVTGEARRRALAYAGQAAIQEPLQHALCRRGAELLADEPDTLSRVFSIAHHGMCDLIAGDFAMATRRAAILTEAGDMTSSRITRIMAAMLTAGVASVHGDIDTILDIRSRTLTIEPSPRSERQLASFDFMTGAALTFWTHADHGVIDALDRYAQRTPDARAFIAVPTAWAYAVTGDLARAEALWSEINTSPLAAVTHDIGRLNAPVVGYELIIRWGTDADATEARSLLEPLSGTWSGNPAINLGPTDYWIARYSALLGERERSERELQRALQQSVDSDAPRWTDRITQALDGSA